MTWIQQYVIKFHTDHSIRQADRFHTIDKNTFTFHNH